MGHQIHSIYKKKDPTLGYHTHKDKRLNLLDKIVLCISIFYPLTAIPQIYKIWIYHDVSGISLLTLILFAVFAFPFLLYGIVHKIRPIIIMNLLWYVSYALVIVGIIIFR